MPMSEKDFLFYLRYWDGSDWYYYEELPNGTINENLTETPIKFAPSGWDDVKREWVRGFTYFGIFSQFTGQYQFVRDGAKILRSIYFTKGVEAKVQLYVKKLNRTIADYGYEDFFKGDIDFKRMNNQRSFFGVEITQSNFIEKLTARESTDVEIQVRDSASRIWVKMHGIHLQYRAKWTGTPAEDVKTFVTHSFTTDEGTNLDLTISDEMSFSISSVSADWSRLIENNTATSKTFTLTYDYNYNVFVPSGIFGTPVHWRLFYDIVDLTSTSIPSLTTLTILSTGTISAGSSQTFVGQNIQTITLNAGEGIRIHAHLLGSSGPYPYDTVYTCTQIESNLLLEYDNVIPTKYIPARRTEDVFSELIDEISDGETTTSSTLLGTTHANKVLSCGDAARNLAKSVMKTNVSDFFKFTNYVLFGAMKYDETTNVVSIEERTSVFENSLIEDLGEVTALEVTAWTDEMFNNLTHGYNSYTYDEVNGKDEFNTKVKRLSPNLRVQQEKNYVSPYRADAYGISLVSLNLDGKEITDASTDNDIWVLHIEDTPDGTIPDGYDGAGEDYYNLYRDTIPPFDIQNIYSPDTMFNIELSPTRNLIRSKAWFASLFHFLGAGYLKFQTSDKSNATNTHMITDDGTTVIDEGADILISEFGDPMLYPIMFRCTIKNPKNINLLLESNPYGYFSFKWLGETYYGFLIKAVDNSSMYAKQEITLLSTAFNDLSKLIY